MVLRLTTIVDEFRVELQETNSRLAKNENELQETKAKLQETNSRLAKNENELQETKENFKQYTIDNAIFIKKGCAALIRELLTLLEAQLKKNSKVLDLPELIQWKNKKSHEIVHRHGVAGKQISKASLTFYFTVARLNLKEEEEKFTQELLNTFPDNSCKDTIYISKVTAKQLKLNYLN